MPKRSVGEDDTCIDENSNSSLSRKQSRKMPAVKQVALHSNNCQVLLHRLPSNLQITNELGHKTGDDGGEFEESTSSEHSGKIEPDDCCTDTLQLSCESVISTPDNADDSHTSTRSLLSRSFHAKSVGSCFVDSNDGSCVGESNVETSKTQVTAIMLQSVANNGTDQNVLTGAAAAAGLLTRYHVQSESTTPSSLTTVLNRCKLPVTSPDGGRDHCYYVCEDAGELKKLLVESNNNKHRLTLQLNTERRYSAKLQKKIEMLETVVVELKKTLETVDPDGYQQLANGKLHNVLRLL
jgi:hypothetical protein